MGKEGDAYKQMDNNGCEPTGILIEKFKVRSELVGVYAYVCKRLRCTRKSACAPICVPICVSICVPICVAIRIEPAVRYSV